jgi:putative tricarboxylic transport membrane protein
VSTTGSETATAAVRAQRRPRWYTGRSELIVVAGLLVIAAGMTVGIVTMEVPEGTAFPGPQFFPTLVAGFLFAVAVALGVTVLVSPRRAHLADESTEVSTDMLEDLGRLDQTSEIRVVAPDAARVGASAAATRVDVVTVVLTVLAIAAFILLLPVLGWLLSAAGLFWSLTRIFGSRRPLFDIAVGVIVSSIVQLAFGAGLGLSLPAGILEGAFPWIS